MTVHRIRTCGPAMETAELRLKIAARDYVEATKAIRKPRTTPGASISQESK